MIQWMVHVLHKTLNSTNHAANENQAWQVKHSWQTCRSLVSAAQNWERRCILQDCQNFSIGIAVLFITDCNDFFWFLKKNQILHSSTYLHPSVKLVMWSYTCRGEMKWIFDQLAWELNFRKWLLIQSALGIGILLGQHGLTFWTFVFWLTVDRLDCWKYVCVSTWHRCLTYVHQNWNL